MTSHVSMKGGPCSAPLCFPTLSVGVSVGTWGGVTLLGGPLCVLGVSSVPGICSPAAPVTAVKTPRPPDLSGPPGGKITPPSLESITALNDQTAFY